VRQCRRRLRRAAAGWCYPCLDCPHALGKSGEKNEII
jgi:hypothetical protein